MARVSSNVSLELYDGSRSQKRYNNVVHGIFSLQNSRSKISHFRPQKSEKSPAKSWRDWLIESE